MLVYVTIINFYMKGYMIFYQIINPFYKPVILVSFGGTISKILSKFLCVVCWADY